MHHSFGLRAESEEVGIEEGRQVGARESREEETECELHPEDNHLFETLESRIS